MTWTELATDIIDRRIYDRAVKHLREAKVVLPTFAQLATPTRIPGSIASQLGRSTPTRPRPATSSASTGTTTTTARRQDVPRYVVLPEALTGVKARILVAFGRSFPMIGAHKVLAAYGCLVPRLVTGQFDPTTHRAVWPSTGNYCRGGVAISRILGCHGVAVLPAGMSRERFAWLERWVAHPEDIVRTPGHREQRQGDLRRVRRLARDPQNIIFNQFCEFGNYLGALRLHRPGAASVFEEQSAAIPGCASPPSPRRPARPARSPPATGSRTSTARDRRGRGQSSARPCSTTATASTTSRASATSTSRSSTT